jgi:DNA-binding response OmpR family regulator
MEKKKILVIDDENDIREALHSALVAAGFEVFLAEDGNAGIHKALIHRPDLILLDILMPNKNGHETLHELRKDTWGKNVPVLFLTNYDDATNITTSVGLKGNDYIIKSQTDLETVVKRVKQFLAGYHE